MASVHPKLSSARRQVALHGGASEQFVPFKAEIRVVPDQGFGRRHERVTSLENTTFKIQNEFLDNANFDDGGQVENIASTPQFGRQWDKVTVVGFWRRSPTPAKPTTDVKIIHSGTAPKERTAVLTGNRGGDLSWTQDPTDQTNSDVLDLITALRNVISSAVGNTATLEFLDFNSIKFGRRANKGFRSFPKA